MHSSQVLLAPIVSEKSYAMVTDRKYTFKVHPDAHKTQIRQAVEELFDVRVAHVNVVAMKAKPKRRGAFKGVRPGWKKAIDRKSTRLNSSHSQISYAVFCL